MYFIGNCAKKSDEVNQLHESTLVAAQPRTKGNWNYFLLEMELGIAILRGGFPLSVQVVQKTKQYGIREVSISSHARS